MHLYHLIHLIDEAYQKKHTAINFHYTREFLYAGIQYPTSKIMIRIWLHKQKPDPLDDTKTTYEWIVWKDSVYTNDLITPDKNERLAVYAAIRKLIESPIDEFLGHWDIDEPDNKLLRILYRTNRESMLRQIGFLREYDVFTPNIFPHNDARWYQDALDELPYRIETERYLKKLIQERNLPKIPKRQKEHQMKNPIAKTTEKSV